MVPPGGGPFFPFALGGLGGRRAHLLERLRAGCLQPENSGPFVLATAPILLLSACPA